MDSNSLKKNSKNKNWPKLQGYKLQFSENNIWHVFKKKKDTVLNKENDTSLTLLQNPTHLKEKYLYEILTVQLVCKTLMNV